MPARPISIFQGSIDELHRLLEEPNGINTLRTRFSAVYGELPGSSEEASWQNSLRTTTHLLRQGHLGFLSCFIELRMPGGAHRCDMVLLGQERTGLRAVIIELKQWTDVTLSPENPDTVLAYGRRVLYPIDQVAYYRAALASFHPLLAYDRVFGCVWLHNMTFQQAEALQRKTAGHSEFIKQFSGEERKELISFIHGAIGSIPVLQDSVEAFEATAFKPSPTLSEICKWLVKDLANVECALLGPAPVTLTNGQHEIFSKYKSLINHDDSRVLLIQGQSGSGKSLIALLMLTYALAHKKRAAMTLVNAHLLEVLVKQMRPHLPVAQNLIINLGTQNPRRTKRFGFLANSSSLDVLICDEGQRTSAEDIEALISPDRAQLTVIFFDERQRLLPNEGGTKARFLSAAEKQKRRTLFKELGSSIRCEGGSAYIQFIESLVYLQHQSLRQPTDIETWRDRYDFRIFSSVEAMRDELRAKHEKEGASVALLASYTKTNGATGEQEIRWKDPLIKWRMKGEYGDFWLREENAKLDTCASIYGSQGLEAQYIGLLWGSDLAFRNNKWVVHPHHEITDSNGFKTLTHLVKDGRYDELIPLLQNRYFIFLTRGIKGTFIHCEDAETAEKLRLSLENEAAFPWTNP